MASAAGTGQWRRCSRATRAQQGVFLGCACAVRVCVCRGALGVLNGPSSQSEVAEAGRDGDVGGAPKAATLARWLPPKASRASMAKGEVLGAFQGMAYLTDRSRAPLTAWCVRNAAASWLAIGHSGHGRTWWRLHSRASLAWQGRALATYVGACVRVSMVLRSMQNSASSKDAPGSSRREGSPGIEGQDRQAIRA